MGERSLYAHRIYDEPSRFSGASTTAALARGIYTDRDFANLMAGLINDLAAGRIKPELQRTPDGQLMLVSGKDGRR